MPIGGQYIKSLQIECGLFSRQKSRSFGGITDWYNVCQQFSKTFLWYYWQNGSSSKGKESWIKLWQNNWETFDGALASANGSNRIDTVFDICKDKFIKNVERNRRCPNGLPFQKTVGASVFRSSSLEIFFKIGALKNFAILTGKTCVGVSF